MAGVGSGAAETFRRLTRMGSITMDRPQLLELQEKFNNVLDRYLISNVLMTTFNITSVR